VVSDGKLRDKLARQCARRGWSVVRLEHEIQRVQPKREYGGREMRRPESLDDILADRERLANRWVRWNEVVNEYFDSLKDREVSSTQLPPAMWKRQCAITREIIKLQRHIQRWLAQ
jgi:hypothetical protein